MPAVIRIVAHADGSGCPIAGQYVVTFDHNAHFGRGEIKTMPDVQYALRFADKAAAMEYWQRTSMIRAVRADGKPNKPMTAYTVAVEDVR